METVESLTSWEDCVMIKGVDYIYARS